MIENPRFVTQFHITFVLISCIHKALRCETLLNHIQPVQIIFNRFNVHATTGVHRADRYNPTRLSFGELIKFYNNVFQDCEVFLEVDRLKVLELEWIYQNCIGCNRLSQCILPDRWSCSEK